MDGVGSRRDGEGGRLGEAAPGLLMGASYFPGTLLSWGALRTLTEDRSLKKSNRAPAKPGLTRRELLTKAGQGSLALAAAQALSPFLLSGCGSSKGADTIKVGILHSLSGVMEISERSLHDVELM